MKYDFNQFLFNQQQPMKPKDVPHRSIAVWPDTISVGNVEGKNESSDTNPSKEAAEAVCRMLKREGFGGEGKVFPLSTRVEPVEEKESK